MARRRLAPHPFSELLRLGLGTFELVETRERHTRRDPRQALANHHHIRADAVFGDDIRQTPLIDVDAIAGAVALETHPAMQEHAGELVARGIRKRRRRVEALTDLRRIDSKQADAAHRRDIDRVAVDDGADQQGI